MHVFAIPQGIPGSGGDDGPDGNAGPDVSNHDYLFSLHIIIRT